MRNEQLMETYLEIANEIIPTATPAGAYCIGLVTALAWKQSVWPERAVLRTAALSQTVDDAVALFDEWESLRARRERQAAATGVSPAQQPSPIR
jgi:hypothetical protein